MIVKPGREKGGGKSTPKAAWTPKLGQHLNNKELNEKVEVFHNNPFPEADPEKEFQRFGEMAKLGGNAKNPLYALIFNPGPGERLTPEQKKEMRLEAMKRLGMEGHDYMSFVHTKPLFVKNEQYEKLSPDIQAKLTKAWNLKDGVWGWEDKGHEHEHLFINRYPPNGGPAVDLKCDLVVWKDIQSWAEKKFGLATTPEQDRKFTGFRKWEIEAAQRHGFDPWEVRDKISEAWQEKTSGKDFEERLKKHGVTLCRGDKTPFVLFTPWGQQKRLASMIEGRPKQKEILAGLKDLDAKALPHIDEKKTAFKAERARLGLGRKRPKNKYAGFGNKCRRETAHTKAIGKKMGGAKAAPKFGGGGLKSVPMVGAVAAQADKDQAEAAKAEAHNERIVAETEAAQERLPSLEETCARYMQKVGEKAATDQAAARAYKDLRAGRISWGTFYASWRETLNLGPPPDRFKEWAAREQQRELARRKAAGASAPQRPRVVLTPGLKGPRPGGY